MFGVLEWIWENLQIPYLRAMEKRIMATLKDVKDAEDKIGTDIAVAVATNADNLKKLSDAISAAADPAEVQSLLDEANAHAAALEAAFPAPAAGTGAAS